MVNVHGYNIYHKNRLIMVTIGTILYSDEKVFDKWFSTAYHNLPTMLSWLLMLYCLWGSLSGKFFTKTAVEAEALLVGLYWIPTLCCIVDNSFLVQLIISRWGCVCANISLGVFCSLQLCCGRCSAGWLHRACSWQARLWADCIVHQIGDAPKANNDGILVRVCCGSYWECNQRRHWFCPIFVCKHEVLLWP